MKIFKRIAIIVVAILALGYGFISWSLSSRVLFPVSSLEKTKKDIIKDWNSTYEEELAKLPTPSDFSVQTFDELTLRGKYFQVSDSSTCAIIFSHGWGDTWAGMLKYVPAFEKCNCDLVFYDHRVHGESDGTYATGSINESKDLLSVTDWVVKEKGYKPNQIGWMGSSWGAAAALMAGAAESDINIAFIVADAPFMSWNAAVFERAIKDYGDRVKLITGGVMKTVGLRSGVDPDVASPLLVANEIDEPVLLMHSKTDSATAYHQSEKIAAELNDQSELHLTEWGNDHVMDVIHNTSDVEKIVTSFIAKQDSTFLK